MKNDNLTKDLYKAVKIENYRGVLIEKLNNGYKCFGISCEDLKRVDLVIENTSLALERSIITQKVPPNEF